MSCYDILQQRANPGVKESGNGARLVGWTAEPRRSERRPDLSHIFAFPQHLRHTLYDVYTYVSLFRFPLYTHILTVFMRIFCVACKVFSWKVWSLQHTASKGEVSKSKRTVYTVSSVVYSYNAFSFRRYSAVIFTPSISIHCVPPPF